MRRPLKSLKVKSTTVRFTQGAAAVVHVELAGGPTLTVRICGDGATSDPRIDDGSNVGKPCLSADMLCVARHYAFAAWHHEVAS